MRKTEETDNRIAFYVAALLIFCLIFFVKDKNSKSIQTAVKQQTIQKTP